TFPYTSLFRSGDLGDLLERGRIERGAHGAPLKPNNCAGRAPTTDGVDAYAAANRLIDHVKWRRKLVVLAVRHEDDRRGRVLTNEVGGKRGRGRTRRRARLL